MTYFNMELFYWAMIANRNFIFEKELNIGFQFSRALFNLFYSGEIKSVFADHLFSSSSSSINWSFFVEVVRDRNAPILAW